MTLIARLTERAAREGLPLESLVRRHLLHGVLRRWSASPHAGTYVLRGALLTQLWVGPQRRATQDLDFLALHPRDMAETVARLQDILRIPLDDGVTFDLDSWRGEVIWRETAFPGYRFLLDTHAAGQPLPLQIDVGFGDPVVPPAWWVDYPGLAGPPARVQAVRPELLVAWKLDGLFERSARRWPAKDLFDLYLLTEHCDLDLPTLAEAIRVAFEAHNDPLPQVLDVVYNRAWWQTEAADSKWARFVAAATFAVPDDLLAVVAAVARRLRPALEQLVAFPVGRVYLS